MFFLKIFCKNFLNSYFFAYTIIANNCDKILNEKQKAFLQIVLGQKASDNFTRRIEELTEEAKAPGCTITQSGVFVCKWIATACGLVMMKTISSGRFRNRFRRLILRHSPQLGWLCRYRRYRPDLLHLSCWQKFCLLKL